MAEIWVGYSAILPVGSYSSGPHSGKPAKFKSTQPTIWGWVSRIHNQVGDCLISDLVHEVEVGLVGLRLGVAHRPRLRRCADARLAHLRRKRTCH